MTSREGSEEIVEPARVNHTERAGYDTERMGKLFPADGKANPSNARNFVVNRFQMELKAYFLHGGQRELY